MQLQDGAGLDQVICNDLRARAPREAQLGLIEDPEVPQLLSAIRALVQTSPFWTEK